MQENNNQRIKKEKKEKEEQDEWGIYKKREGWLKRKEAAL